MYWRSGNYLPSTAPRNKIEIEERKRSLREIKMDQTRNNNEQYEEVATTSISSELYVSTALNKKPASSLKA